MARTPKARALGAALRQAREEKQILLRQLGAAIDRDIGVLSRWETGERTPKPEHVAQILTRLDVEGDRFAEIMTLAYGTNEPLWLATTLPEQRRQMTAFLDWERNARRIVEFSPLLVPGVLQTSDYIRAMMTAPGANIPASEVASRIATRIGRRQALTKHNPAKLLALIGQAALTQEIGGRQVMIEQLRHLLEMAAWLNVELRIVPDRRGWHPGLEGEFTLIETPLTPTSLASIVCVGNRRTVLILHEDDDVADYRSASERILGVSLPPEKSAAFIAELIHRMENYHG
ncbi:MAG TPA: helix-turn-helix transcriptional regulator [Actinophytocola sp.]|jgi:transcriptional regulator with XRE-family HTH domain|uniref:helix-turn-helix domain-containing protein n=1 Tax=Actinophytocola sp. TaxID=1872138 RepID=UPI002E090AAB|nr:helix-turn-helix transcriptional regulator [Actinophytocola sp.]